MDIGKLLQRVIALEGILHRILTSVGDIHPDVQADLALLAKGGGLASPPADVPVKEV